MSASTSARAAVLLALAVLLVLTRSHQFGALPDASWAVFFLGGCHLRAQTRWAFVLLMALAALVDAVVISASGLDFWQHYCVSPAYGFLLPAYFSLWLAGAWLAPRLQRRWGGDTLLQTALALLLGHGLCYLISDASFYWLGGRMPDPDPGVWLRQLPRWYPSFLASTVLYVVPGMALHAAARAIGWMPGASSPGRAG